MSTAVFQAKTRNEPAKLTDGFLQFAMHYGFETQVCNPRSGHEKGNVENKVGYVRYNFFSSTPIMQDFESFNKTLAEQLSLDLNREHYEKHSFIQTLWEEEKSSLLFLPPVIVVGTITLEEFQVACNVFYAFSQLQHCVFFRCNCLYLYLAINKK